MYKNIAFKTKSFTTLWTLVNLKGTERKFVRKTCTNPFLFLISFAKQALTKFLLRSDWQPKQSLNKNRKLFNQDAKDIVFHELKHIQFHN